MGSAAALLLSAAIVLGSRMLRDFDPALLPYAVATVFLAFGIACRCTVRCGDPAARRLHRPGRPTLSSKGTPSREDTAREDTAREDISRADISRPDTSSADVSSADVSRERSPKGGSCDCEESLSEEDLRRVPAALPRETATGLGLGLGFGFGLSLGFGFRKFVGAHSAARWVAHQLLFWGCLLVVLISVPLVWGWLTFTAATAPGPGYDMRIWGFRVIGFDPSDVIGWIVFHGLDLAALLVIAGVGYFLWRRLRDRAAAPGPRVAYDLVPLLALLAVSITGLLLTCSALFLHGGGYRFLALLHMASVVFTLVYLPFGKFFHPVQRSGGIGGKPFAHAARRDE